MLGIHRRRMAFPVKQDEAFDPHYIRFFRARAVVARPNLVTHSIEELSRLVTHTPQRPSATDVMQLLRGSKREISTIRRPRSAQRTRSRAHYAIRKTKRAAVRP